jgi:hypothetical protein
MSSRGGLQGTKFKLSGTPPQLEKKSQSMLEEKHVDPSRTDE